MRLLKMTGGLGNQMFIYALYISMKQQGINVRIDLSDMVHYHAHYGYEMHKVFGLPNIEFRMNQKLKKIVEFLFFKTILERKQHGSLKPYFGKQVWPLVYYKGFYQNERYFSGCADMVKRAFTFDMKQANERSLQAIKQIDNDPHAVSIHIRRGDYLQPKHFKFSGCVCTTNYYQRAIDYMLQCDANAHFYVFSDGLEWVKQNIKLPENAVFVDWNCGTDSWQDMMLMTHCKHNVICNSTFSWWGAWLNNNPNKKVICPDKWSVNDKADKFVPDSWIMLPTTPKL